MHFEALWLQSGIVLLEVAALVLALVLVRRRAVTPLVVFGGVILVAQGGTLLLMHLPSEGATPPALQVLSLYASIAPFTVLLIYVCVMQARRYMTARNNDRLRTWFLRAPYVCGGSFSAAFLGDIAVWPPLFESTRGISVVGFFIEAQHYVIGVVYASVASLVFFGAAKAGSGPPYLSQRLQNLFWGIAIAGLSAIMAYGLVLGGIRVFPLEEVLSTTLAGHLSAYYSVLYVLQAGGIVLGISCYYAQGKRSRFTERFLHFLDLVADLAEELANAPISKGKLNLPYAVMHQAANKEFLALSPIDKRRMDNAFRARIIWEYRAGEGYKGCRGRISRRRLTDLAKVYDDEFRESVLAKGLAPGKAGGKRLPDTLQDLLPGDAGKKGLGQGLDESLSAALKTGKTDGKADQIWSPEWEQLAYVALADAGLLPSAQEAAIHNGCWVSEKVLDAYRLARYKVHSYKGELALADDQKA